MVRLAHLFLFSIIIGVALASEAVPESKHVLTLTKDNFSSVLAEHEVVLVDFYAPWCGHCKHLGPQFSAAAEELQGIATLAAIDCVENRELCQEHGVRGYPTLKVFRKDSTEAAKYEGGRTSDDMVKYMKRQVGPAYTVIKASEIDEVRQKQDVIVVGFFNSIDDVQAKGFIETASSLRSDYSFLIVLGQEEATSVNQQTPSVVLYNKDGISAFNPYKKSFLTDFVTTESLPLVGDEMDYQTYIDRNLAMLLIFIDFDNEAANQPLLDTIKEVSKQYKGRLGFIKLDGIQYNNYAKTVGLKGTLPGLAIEDRMKRKNYIFPADQTVTQENLSKFVSDYLVGKLVAVVKSEEPPKNNNGPVKVVVGKTFNQLVFDETKDVMVEFYAPWCGHCKKLTPIYEELGKEFLNNDSVMIAKVDSTANDIIGFEVRSYPTIYFFPADKKTDPIKYTGDRTVEAMAAFIKKEGSAYKKWEEQQSKKTTKDNKDDTKDEGDFEEYTSEHDEL